MNTYKLKYSEIERFIHDGDYEVSAPMNHIKRMLENFEDDYGLDLNPDFQRGHGAIRS